MRIRAAASAILLGALGAAVTHAASLPSSRDAIGGWGGAPVQTTEAKSAIDDFPICSSMAAIGEDADWARLDADFAAGKRALAAEDWNGAIAALKLAALRDPGNADIANDIGYAYRRLRQLGPAMGYYQQAVVFNPRHRSAREHLGELFLMLHEPAEAQQQLAALERICLLPCQELGGLERAIASYSNRVMISP
jgi:tetratricopeptide (TPR) repeat protein